MTALQPILISQSCRRGVQGARYLNPSVEHESLGRLKHRIKVPGTRNISENLAFNGVSLLPRALFRFLPPPSLPPSLSLLFKQVLRNSSILGRKLTDMKYIRKILSPRLLFLSTKWKEKENVYRILWIVSNKVVMKINKARDYSPSLNYLYPLELSLRTGKRIGEKERKNYHSAMDANEYPRFRECGEKVERICRVIWKVRSGNAILGPSSNLVMRHA